MYCVRCGRALPPDSAHCLYCGASTSLEAGPGPTRLAPRAPRLLLYTAPARTPPRALRALVMAIGALFLVVTAISSFGGPFGFSGDEAAEPTAADAEPVKFALPPLTTPGIAGTEVAAVAEAQRSVVRVVTDQGSGTGIVISADGYFLTNNHVVEDAREITVQLPDGRRLPARVVRRSAAPDLALLQATASDLAPAAWGDSETLQLGQTVLAIGHSLGLQGSPTVSRGIVSALRTQRNVHYVQTDAALNPGNSGGPLVDLRGAVVGINTMRLEGEGLTTVQGVNFAIAGSEVRGWLTQQLAR